MIELKISGENFSDLRAQVHYLNVYLNGAPKEGFTEEVVEEVKQETVVEVEGEIEEVEEVEENIATKMTYWKLEDEYGSSRKDAVIPEGAELFSSKASWEKDQEQEEVEEDEEVVEKAKPAKVKVDRDAIIDKMGGIIQKDGKHKKDIVSLLARFDAKRFGDVDKSDYNEFYDGLVGIEMAGA